MDLAALQPTRKDHVFDLVRAAGIDVSDWIASSNDQRGYKANPKYCYEWSFIESGIVVVLNLWHDAMTEEQGLIVQRNNFRSDARDNAGKPTWVRRATKLDGTLQVALRENLPVRVIINHGLMRNKGDPSADPSRVTARQLDPEPWTITEYDWDTGAHAITRGILRRQFVDQFDIDQADKGAPGRREVTGSAFVRDPAVRHSALRRAGGKCEYCGSPGFKMSSGAIYLETHHVVPLSENGVDHVSNVAALCPNDHRRAHYGEDGLSIRTLLLRKLANQSGGPGQTQPRQIRETRDRLERP